MTKRSLYMLIAAAGLLAGCKKQDAFFKSELIYDKVGAPKYAFTVQVRGEEMFFSARRDGLDLPGISGNRVPGGKVSSVEAADLNSDGKPEVYVFFAEASGVPPGLLAFSCGEKDCSSIGIEGGAGGEPPRDYCGGDSYKTEHDRLVRQYNGCGMKAGERLYVKYALKTTSFGLMLSKAGEGKTVTTNETSGRR